jgi:hypothetical protein
MRDGHRASVGVFESLLRLPCFAQVHLDTMTRPEDVQSIYDALPVEDKELHWIEGTDRRFDGYNYFGVHPEVPIDWFNNHLK